MPAVRVTIVEEGTWPQYCRIPDRHQHGAKNNAGNPNATDASHGARPAFSLATKYALLYDEHRCGFLIRYGQCTWGPESAKRPISKQLVESLRRMNKQLHQRIRFLETQLAQHTSHPVDEVVQSGSSLSLRISDRGSPSSYGGGPSSPASIQSEPVYCKTEPQDVDIDHIIAPTQHLHVRTVLFTSHPRASITREIFVPVAEPKKRTRTVWAYFHL